MNKNILLCGVGGQGTVLASKLLATAAMGRGIPVMSAETIGMAQKGGSVFSHLRIGDALYSPMLAMRSADLLIGFEPAEATRMLPYLKKNGRLVVSAQAIIPVMSVLKRSTYDGGEMIGYLRKNVRELFVVDTARACAEIGSAKVANIVMLGAALRFGNLGFTPDEIREAMRQRVRPQFYEINSRALDIAERMILS